jgi:nucleotide-binding universal stress UspA family protein
LPLNFVCNRCGYTAEFDSQLFNPAYLARLAGEKPERVANLTVRDYRLLVPLRGDERSHTLLDLATAIAKSRSGDIIVLDVAKQANMSEQLAKKLHDYQPRVGSPAPVTLTHRGADSLKTELPHVVMRHRCDLLLIQARGWDSKGQAGVAPLIEEILRDDLCEVAIVQDRGLGQVNRVLLATSGGPNAQAASPLVLDVVRAFDAELHLFYIASPDDPDSQDVGQHRIAETLGEFNVEDLKLQRRILVDADPVQALIRESARYDLLVMGGSPRDWRGKIRLDSFSAKVARNTDTTAIVLIAPGDQPPSFFSWLLRL